MIKPESFRLKSFFTRILQHIDKVSQTFFFETLFSKARSSLKQITVSYTEIAHCLDKSISKIEEAILKALETTPPELAADIYRRGLYLTGGGALLRGLDKRLSAKIKLPVHVADDPLKSVVRGTGLALKNYQRFPFIMR